MTDEQMIAALEDQRGEALIAGDHARLERILADAFLYTHASGKVDDKTSYLAFIATGAANYHSIVRDDTRLLVYGTAAVMNGRITVVVDHAGERKQLRNRFSAFWAKQSQGWQMVSWQVTACPA